MQKDLSWAPGALVVTLEFLRPFNFLNEKRCDNKCKRKAGVGLCHRLEELLEKLTRGGWSVNAALQRVGKSLSGAAVLVALGLIGTASIGDARAQILGSAESFGVLTGSTVTNTGPSVIEGNVGVWPGNAIVGFSPGIVVAPGTKNAGNAVAQQAQSDLTTAYNTLMGMPTTSDLTGQNLGGKTLIAGVYGFASSAQLTGLLTLNGQGNSASNFIFKVGSTLTTASDSAVLLINGANGNNVYWAVGSSATLGTNTAFAGNIVALTSITLNTGASITCGRALARNGAVTLDNNTITLCANTGGTTGTGGTGGTMGTGGTGGTTGTGGTGGTTGTGGTGGTTGTGGTGGTTGTGGTGGTTATGGTGGTTGTGGTMGTGGGPTVTQNQLFGEGVSGTQQTALNASKLFGTALLGQAAFFGQNLSGAAPQSYRSMKDAGYDGGAGWVAADGYQPGTWRSWVTGLGGTASLDGNSAAGSASLDSRITGFAAGIDYQIDRSTLIGIAGGYTNSTFSVDQVQTSGTVEGAHAGLYGVKSFGPLYLAGSAEYAHFYNETQRLIDFVVNERAIAHFAADNFSGQLEAGWRHPVDGYYVTPFAGVEVSSLTSGKFSETSARLSGGPGILGLTFGSDSVTSLESLLGVQFDTQVALSNGQLLTPFARAAWVHEFNPERGVNARLTLSPGASFSPPGAFAASDSAKVDAGVKFDVTGSIALFAYFEGEFSGQSQSYSGNGGIKIRW